MELSIEEIISQEEKSPLFDAPFFIEQALSNKYDSTNELCEILREAQKNNEFEKEIYTMSIFLKEKDKQYQNIISQIEKKYCKIEVIHLFDEEVLNWIDDEQMKDEGYSDEHEYYTDFNNREAQDAIHNSMIQFWQTTHNDNKELNIDDHCKIFYLLEEKYEL